MVPLIDLDQAKAQLNYDPANTTDDAEIQRYVDAVIRVVEDHKGEIADPRTITDELHLANAGSFLLRNVPVQSLITVQTVDGGTTWDVTDLHVNESSGRVTVLSGAPVSGLVEVTYEAGYSTPPPHYRQAALIILSHLWETQRGVGIINAGVIGAEEAYDPRYSFSIPRKALELLGSPLPGVA